MGWRREIDTTWSVTQVGLRPVESGLGGHEEGVRGVDEGVENASPPFRKRGGTALSECATFSDFTGVPNDVVNEKRDDKNTFRLHVTLFETRSVSSSITVVKEK